MFTPQTLHGHWNEIKGKLLSKWGALTDDDLAIFHGNGDQLVGTIQRKTGEARVSIEQFFQQLTSDSAAEVSGAGETVRAGSQQAADSVQETCHKVAASVREGYAEVENIVRQRPAESLAVCFGAGVVTGVVVSLLLRWRGPVTPPPSFGKRTELAAEKLGRQMLDALAGVLPESLSKHMP